MRTYDSASFDFPITGTRKDAIEKARKFLESLGVNGIDSGRYTWRAADDSGFTFNVTVNLTGVYVELAHKWNKSRNS